MRTATKAGILVLSSAAGTAIGYPVFLFVSLALLVFYGDDGQRGHPTEFVANAVFYGVFGMTTLIGFAAGLFLVKARKDADSKTIRSAPTKVCP
jgi:hypothetical protein